MPTGRPNRTIDTSPVDLEPDDVVEPSESSADGPGALAMVDNDDFDFGRFSKRGILTSREEHVLELLEKHSLAEVATALGRTEAHITKVAEGARAKIASATAALTDDSREQLPSRREPSESSTDGDGALAVADVYAEELPARVLTILTERELLILELLRTRTHQEVAATLGITAARVSQIGSTAVAKLAGMTPEQRERVGHPSTTVVEGEIVGPLDAMPKRSDLIARGRASLVDLGRDPDQFVDAETDRELRRATPASTIDTTLWGWGRFITYCGRTSRRHEEPTSATIRQYIKDHWHMTAARGKNAGKKMGRYGRPYAPATVELAVYTVAMVCNRMGWPNPVRDPLVNDQLKAYQDRYEEAGFRSDESDPITHDMSVALARTHDLRTVQGLRNATMLRIHFDAGCRTRELCAVQWTDIKWLDERRFVITFVATHTKTKKKREVGIQSMPELDGDVDPVVLFRAYYEAVKAAGLSTTSGPVFLEVNPGRPWRDFAETGILGGKFTTPTTQISTSAYEQMFTRTVARSKIGRDPVTGERLLHITPHSCRAGLITEAVDAGLNVDQVAARTGHNPSSPVIHDYYRSGKKWGDTNAGLVIRRRRDGGEGA